MLLSLDGSMAHSIESPTLRDESDCDSTSSSVPGSRRSWMSNLSFGSRRSSMSSVTKTSSLYTPATHKPHKSNQAAWEAIKRLQAANGRVGLEHFRLLRRLGSGDIGNVYLCQIRNPMVGLPQSFYAMKVVDREALAIRNKEQRAEMEKEILAMVDHPFLPSLYAEFEASHYSCIVMEYCPGGDLYVARQRRSGKRFSISSAKFYASEVLLALEYLHMMGIVYRDLKPENVLIREDGHIMLSDFDLCFKCDVVPKLLRSTTLPTYIRETTLEDDNGKTCFTPTCATPIRPVLSCLSNARGRKKAKSQLTKIIREQADGNGNGNGNGNEIVEEGSRIELDAEVVAEPIDARSKSFVGTHEYLAPEVITGQGHGSAVDWWTLGVFIYEMVYGRTPFKGENNKRTLMNILKQPLTFPRIIGVSSNREFEDLMNLQDLLSKLLVKNPKKRIGSVNGSVEIKRQEFFRGINWALIRTVRPPEVPGDQLKITSSRGQMHKLSKKERDEPFQISRHGFDYF